MVIQENRFINWNKKPSRLFHLWQMAYKLKEGIVQHTQIGDVVSVMKFKKSIIVIIDCFTCSTR